MGSEGSVEQTRELMNKKRIRGLRCRASGQAIAKPIFIKDTGVAYGVLRLVGRTTVGFLVEVRLPHEIRAVRAAGLESAGANAVPARLHLEQTDFLKTRQLRGAVHARESGLCFYCRKRLTPLVMCRTTSFRASAPDTIPTAIWFPAASNAIRKRASARRPTSFAGSTASSA